MQPLPGFKFDASTKLSYQLIFSTNKETKKKLVQWKKKFIIFFANKIFSFGGISMRRVAIPNKEKFYLGPFWQWLMKMRIFDFSLKDWPMRLK